MAPTVLYDACVLYPAPLRDLLMRLALTGLFQARWTDEIHDEWTRNVAANRPDITVDSLDRCRKLMDDHVPDSLVVGYEHLIPGLTLPDLDDRHVLAAAIHGGAGTIVTFNLGDFPASVLDGYHIRAIHPDRFVVRLWSESPEAILEAARRQRQALRRPPRTAAEYLATLSQCRLTETVACLLPFEHDI
ncbi:PIN domain-containing protein [Paludisphaera sp.]|uniref:PIN domain-containing protein n=1 Tax=Paludisphaera sp. TaxID=2017432 RepID=UPI00301DE648